MENTQKGFSVLLGVLIFAAVALVGTGAYVYYNKTAEESPAPAAPQVQIPATGSQPAKTPTEPGVTVTSEPAIDNPSTWQTYSNTEYGFEFKYPPTFKFCDTRFGGDEAIREIVRLTGVDQDCEVSEGYDAPTDAVLVHQEISMGKKYPDMASLEKDAVIGQKLTVGGVQLFEVCGVQKNTYNGLQFLTLCEDSAAGEGGGVGNYTFHNGKLINFLYVLTDSNYESKKKVVEQVLSTFKFTDNSVKNDISGWKTYSNEEYSFEIKYPPAWKIEDKGLSSSSTPELDLMSDNLDVTTGQPNAKIKIAVLKKDDSLKSVITGSKVLYDPTFTVTQPGSKLTIFNEGKCYAPKLFEGTLQFYAYGLAGSLMSDPTYGTYLIDTNRDYVLIVTEYTYVGSDRVPEIFNTFRPLGTLEFVKTACQ